MSSIINYLTILLDGARRAFLKMFCHFFLRIGYFGKGINAYDYYNANATPKHMANGVLNAIYYAMNH